MSKLPEEVGVIVEVIGEDEEEARAVAATAKQYLLHAPNSRSTSRITFAIPPTEEPRSQSVSRIWKL